MEKWLSSECKVQRHKLPKGSEPTDLSFGFRPHRRGNLRCNEENIRPPFGADVAYSSQLYLSR
eukprot:1195748-Prorocentrum_minimum.AAC.8